MSEVFLVAWRRLDDCPADALPWLLACARRVLANQRRGDDRRSALAQRVHQTSPVAVVVALDDGGLARALAELSGPDRELLLLIAWDGLDPVRAAAALGCTRATLAVRLHRARRRLAAALARVEAADAATVRTLEAVR